MGERAGSTAAWDELSIVRIDGARRYKRTDRVIREEAYTLFINDREVHRFACTPIDLEELAIGYAFSEGYCNDKQEIQGITCDRAAQELRLFLKRGDAPPPAGAVSVEVSLTKNAIYTLWEAFNEQSNLFHITGAVHAMAVTEGSNVLVLQEDVSRYNAVAKAIGKMLLHGIRPEGKALLFSGRLALKLLMMIERTGVRILLCHGAVSSGAVRRAEAVGITLAGFLKRGYMNIYTHSERISDG
ncbi:MAG: formate dehydrogenase accessory sulfurtransferase FdhD [Treponema sp.]|jgi:FdhD protein|nr:formate dehydrogenase accessory sulfurtransferase FdhD [Treponema sp.]